MSKTIKSYKGMDKDMRCKGFKYEVGKTYETEDAKACQCGFHACEAPLDVLRYYPLRDGNRYFEVEQSGELSRNGEDSKVASTKLTVGSEIGIPDLLKAHVEWVRNRAKTGTAGGDESNLAGGDWSVIVGRNNTKAKGGLRSVIVLTGWNIINSEYTPVTVKAIVVDGEKYKPDTWYTLKNGEIVEVSDET